MGVVPRAQAVSANEAPPDRSSEPTYARKTCIDICQDRKKCLCRSVFYKSKIELTNYFGRAREAPSRAISTRRGL